MERVGEFVKEFVVPWGTGGSVSLERMLSVYVGWVEDAHGEASSASGKEFVEAIAKEFEKEDLKGRYDERSQRFSRIGIRTEEARYRFSRFAKEYFGSLEGPVALESLEEAYRSWMTEKQGGLPSGSKDKRISLGLGKAAQTQGYGYDPMRKEFRRTDDGYREFSEEFFGKGNEAASLSSVVKAYDSWMTGRGGRPPEASDTKVVVGLVEAAESLGFVLDPTESRFRSDEGGFDEFARGFFVDGRDLSLVATLEGYGNWAPRNEGDLNVFFGLLDAAKRLGFVMDGRSLSFRREKHLLAEYVDKTFVEGR